jgi:PAS domain S-box-containing protein
MIVSDSGYIPIGGLVISYCYSKREGINDRGHQMIAPLQQENQRLHEQVAEQQAEIARLHKEIKMCRGLFDQLSFGIYIYHLEDLADDWTLRMIAANSTVEELTGLSPDKIVGKTLDENFPGLREHGVPQAFAEVVRSGEPFEMENVYGDERVIESAFAFRAVALPGNCVAVLFENITARKQSEQRMVEYTEESQMFQAVIDAAPDGIAFASLDTGRIFYANPVFRAMCGYGDQTIGMPFTDIYTESPARMAQIIQEATEQGVWRGEVGSERKDGSTFPAELSGTVLRGADGQPRIAAGLLRDLTVQKQAEAERAELQQQIIEAQRNALRELSTPLIPISDKVMIMPLIGAIDSGRAQQIMEALLDGVAQHHADLVILDITGIRVVDTQVAQAFIQAAQAVRLLGAQVMLTGIGPQIAQTLVSLGIDLSGIQTQGNLQTGIAAALSARAIG